MDREFAESVLAADEARAGFARFLASLFLYELTQEQIEQLAHLNFDRDGSKVASGYAQMVEYLRHRNRATKQELAVDYAHTFLGAGVYDRVLAPPYESVFTSAERLLMQESRDGALAYYRSEGLDLPADNGTPEDHLGFELQFVATLIERADAALKAGDEDRFRELVVKQRSFLKFHQENWLAEFADAIDEFCQTGFYHGLAKLTRGYLEVEREILDAYAAELGIEGEEAEIRSAWMDLPDEDDGCALCPNAAAAAAGVAAPVKRAADITADDLLAFDIDDEEDAGMGLDSLDDEREATDDFDRADDPHE